MKFKVPRHIEYESKIVAGVTFKQMAYLGVGGISIFFLYFILPFILFVLVSIPIAGASAALAFVTVGTQTLPEYLKNFFYFSTTTKTYLWKKKDLPPVLKTTKKEEKEEKEEKADKRPKGKSKLDDMSTKIETS